MMSVRVRSRCIWSVIVVLVMFSFACQSLSPFTRPTGTPGATETPASPTVTPMPLPAPKLFSRTPALGEKLPIDAPLELVFDQPMNRESVEEAFSITPEVAGRFDWEDDRILHFTTDASLAQGEHYQVTVGDGAQNREGKSLVEPVTFVFSTVGFLEVTQVQPAPDSEDLDPNTLISVSFNRPVVPLTAIGSQADLPDPLKLIPPVPGKGEWLNTSTYLFRPEDGLLPATQYRAQISTDFVDTLGQTLAEPYTWRFSTLRPAVLETFPNDGFRYFGPTDVISITFNQPMVHSSVEDRFTLKIDGRPVVGNFRWTGGDSPLDPETMSFLPTAPLPRDADCEAQLEAGAQPAEGEWAMLKTTTLRFRTVMVPAVLDTVPYDGEEDVDPFGDIRFTFASPMEVDDFMDHLRITPAVTEVYTYWSELDTQLNLSLELEPATAYQVTLDAQTPDRYDVPLGQPLSLRFTTGNLPPYAWFNTHSRLNSYSTYTETMVYATVRNVSRVDVGLYELSPETFMELNGYGDWDAWSEYRPKAGDLLRQWSQPVTATQNATVQIPVALTSADRAPIPPGLYYVQMTAPEILEEDPEVEPSRFMFVKSGINLTLKQAPDQSLVWATDLMTGDPVSGLGIRFHSQFEGWHASGTTDSDGVYMAKLSEEEVMESSWDAYFAFAGEPGQEGFAVAYNSWTDGISPWDFDMISDFDPSAYKGYLYTDRPIYRPGQLVYFKGIVRLDDDASYRIPVGLETIDVRIDDPQGRQVYSEALRLSDMGTLYGELLLSPEAPLGTYYLMISHPELFDLYASTTFQVAEYRKPEYEVTLLPDREAYVDGETLNVETESTYYFGGAVADAEVHWSVLSSAYNFGYVCPAGETCPNYSWSDYDWSQEQEGAFYDGYGKLISEGDTTTDAQGRATFKVPADISDETQSRRFTLEATVTDINGQAVSNRTAAVVHQGTFYIGVAPQGYIAEVGEEKTVDLLTVDWESQPVSNVPLELVFYEQRWYSVREQGDGGYYWSWSVEEIPVFTTTVTTGRDGRAHATFTPEKAGSYKVRATGRDRQEHEIRSSAFFWVWGGGYVSWRQENNNRITLVADRDSYAVGDVAEVLVPSPYTGTVKALVTLERGRVLETEVRTFQSNSEVLRIPIKVEHAPNVFVSVVLVQGADRASGGIASFKMGMAALPVSVEQKELQIELIPDKRMEEGEAYAPREKATYTVQVTDYQGKPVEAELSLRLADLAVLALADEPGLPLLDTFWRERGVGVRTSMPLVVAMEPYNRDLAPGAKGGGGGGPADSSGLVRSNFADTAFWDPVVRTDSQGLAKVEVTLPDNLTTWRMQARGITGETLVGRAEVDILSTLDLLVRPVLPRFFVVGDRAEIATVVHNNTERALEADVTLDVTGLEIAGDVEQLVRIPAGETAKVSWLVTVLPGDSVTVRTTAQAEGGLSDSREDTLPVYQYATPEVVATAGRLSEPGAQQEIVQLPPTFDPTQGELTVQIDGSLTSATQDALRYLEHYPYECTEQTVSRFLPNVLTYQALEEMGVADPELRGQLKELVGVALQRLYNQRHYDGGWGWWVSDQSDPYLTAYVLHGLLEAHRAGFVVDRAVIDEGVSFLRDNLPRLTGDTRSWEANRMSYMVYVLSDYAEIFESDAVNRELGRAIQLFERRALLDYYGRATLAVALGVMEPSAPERMQTLLDDLAGDAVMSATGTHWEEVEPDFWNMNTDVRTTAIVLWAMARLEPDNPQLPNVVRWLMAMRTEGAWETTQDTSWSLMALVAYMQASGEMRGDFDYTVYLNGHVWGEGTVSKEALDEGQQLQVEIAQLLVSEGNRLVIERQPGVESQTGEGQLYYAAQLRYFLPVEEVEALDRGIVIARQYSPVEEPERYVESAEVGDVVRVKLMVIAPTDLYYVVVEDPLPAGFEGVDLSLKTTSVVGERPALRNLTVEEEEGWFRRSGLGWWWFSHSEMRDEKMALFATYLPRGTYEYTYLIRASVPGEFLVMPASAYEMYFPEVFGRSNGGKFVVE